MSSSQLSYDVWDTWDVWDASPRGSDSILNSFNAPLSMEDVPKSGFSAIDCDEFSLLDCS